MCVSGKTLEQTNQQTPQCNTALCVWAKHAYDAKGGSSLTTHISINRFITCWWRSKWHNTECTLPDQITAIEKIFGGRSYHSALANNDWLQTRLIKRPVLYKVRAKREPQLAFCWCIIIIMYLCVINSDKYTVD